MVSSEHDALIRQYVKNFNGRYLLKKYVRSCDRCRPDMSARYLIDIKEWMQNGPDGAPPYLCTDCARHYGLEW